MLMQFIHSKAFVLTPLNGCVHRYFNVCFLIFNEDFTLIYLCAFLRTYFDIKEKALRQYLLTKKLKFPQNRERVI